MKKKKLFLIDGNSFCYRAFYAIKELSNSKGQFTNAVFGFVRMLKKLMSDERPDYLAVTFDLKGPTFRHRKFITYKINRKPMPDDLMKQMPIIKDIICAYNIPIYEKEGFEADDIFATLAKKISKQGIEVYIVTGDKDALQLVDDNIRIYNAYKEDSIYDIEAVKKRFGGLEPKDVVDVMALAGDTIDNIPGVRGIGEKTAIDLIKEFTTIENLYNNLNKVKSEVKKKLLTDNKENAYISKELAILDTSVPIDIDINAMCVKEPNTGRLLQIFKELEFKTFAKEICHSDPDISRSACYKTILDKCQFDALLERLKEQKEFAMDFETSNDDPLKAVPIGISFCWKEGEAYYVALSHESEIDVVYVFNALKDIFEDGAIKKIGQGIKYGKLLLSRYGIGLEGVSFDTMIAGYLLNPSKLSYSLDDLAFEHIGYNLIAKDELLTAGPKSLTMDNVSLDKIAGYSCEVSDVTLRLKKIFEKELFDKELYKLFEEIELPLIDVLSEMEKNGVRIDVGLLRNLSKDMEKELSLIVENIYRIAGVEFNINSHKQLSDILFKRVGLPPVKKTKTGLSTDMGVLERLSSIHPLPKELLRYRELSKLKSTYVDTLPELINPETKRLHTSFNQTGTATGRLSSSKPNLQNIPIRTEQAKLIRKAFIGDNGNFIMSADYSQIELRILAHLSKDEEFIESFENDRDIHTHTSSLIFGVSEKDITAEMRANAKAVNFGIIYGMSAYGLSKSLSIDTISAQRFIDSYFERYPRVKMYIEQGLEDARETGYVTTLFNRRRYLPEINSSSTKERQQAERMAINTPIQGSSADLIKIAMVNIFREMKVKNVSSKMILQVHDELVFEVNREEITVMQKMVKGMMESAVRLCVPVKVTVKYGENWLDMEEM